MSPFTIFFLVVTFLYIIYYAVIITIDLNAKPKSEGDSSETLDTEGMLANADANDDSSYEPSTDREESYDSPAVEDYQPSGEEYHDDAPISEETEETSTPSPSEMDEDNPYGLTDDDNPGSIPEEQIEEVNTPSETTPAEEEKIVPEQESHEPELRIYEPPHVNGGLAEQLNASNETIEVESLTPCKPEMLADNVFDIVGIKRSFYGNDAAPELTLSEKLPMQNDEESCIMDKI